MHVHCGCARSMGADYSFRVLWNDGTVAGYAAEAAGAEMEFNSKLYVVGLVAWASAMTMLVHFRTITVRSASSRGSIALCIGASTSSGCRLYGGFFQLYAVFFMASTHRFSFLSP